ncbi:MAG: hypothetical protein AAF414_20110 [Pseudomonadota bacterium]
MRTSFLLYLAIVATVTMSITQAASAQEGLPNLEGTWNITDGRILYFDGSTNHFTEDFVSFEIRIIDQNEGVFGGYFAPVHEDSAAPGYHGDELGGDERYALLGVIGWDAETIIFADVDDTSSVLCDLIDIDTMHCTSWETGERALVGRMILTRAVK